MLAEAITATILSNNTDVTDIVDGNIFTSTAGNNQAGYYIMIYLASTTPQTSKGGPADVDECHMQVDCFGSDGATVVQLADAIRRALEFTNTVVNTAIGSANVQGCILLNSSRSQGYDSNSRAEGLRRVTQDFQIRIERTP